MPLFVVVLLKRTIYNKETKREAENERREKERNQSGHKKTPTADSAPDLTHNSKFCQKLTVIAFIYCSYK